MKRAYSVRVLGVDDPGAVTVGGREVDHFDYDAEARLLTIDTRPLSTRRAGVVRIAYEAG